MALRTGRLLLRRLLSECQLAPAYEGIASLEGRNVETLLSSLGPRGTLLNLRSLLHTTPLVHNAGAVAGQVGFPSHYVLMYLYSPIASMCGTCLL